MAALGFGLSATGATWGLPARWHPDEKADSAAAMLREGQLRPDSFINPSLPLYLSLPPLWMQERAARRGFLWGRGADPVLLGRLLAALAGAVAVFLLGRLGSGSQEHLGVLAAALLALSPGMVNLCHFATPEAWLILGSTATLLLCLRYLEGRVPAGILGLVLGLTASTKYTAAALVVPCLIAIWARPPRPLSPRERVALVGLGLVAIAVGLALIARPGDVLAAGLHLKDARLLHPEHARGFVGGAGRALLAAGLAVTTVTVLAMRGRPWAVRIARGETLLLGSAALAGFLAGTPYAALSPTAFLSDLAFNHQTRFEYKGLAGSSTSFAAYLGMLADAFTGPLLAAAVLGTIIASARALRGDHRATVLVSAGIVPYLLVASSGHQAMRFLAPMFPATACLGAFGLQAIASPAARRAGTVLVLAREAMATLLVLRLFFVDSRIQAERWMAENIPPGETVDLIANNPGYAPSLPEGRALRVVPTLSREMAPADRFQEAARAYPAQASRWLVLTASFYERFLEHPDLRPERAAFFRDLLEGRSGFDVAARFRQTGWRRPQAEFLDPEIVILRKR